MTAEERLHEIIPGDVKLRLIEPHLYSVYSPGENTNEYDGSFGSIYDIVACNRFYNRCVWGYSTSEYPSFCLDALGSSANGWVLDAGCGSLAFTAGTYVNYKTRPVVLLDQSVNMLRMARTRLAKLNGAVPPHIVFLHGDVLRLPFRDKIIRTIISLNVLHVLDDIKSVLGELKRVRSDRGTLSLTTMIENNRCGDRYLHLMGRAGKLFPRNQKQLSAAFDDIGLSVKYRIRGNMAFISSR